MSANRLFQIPKVIIGNPETKGIAYDVIPNYRPKRVPAITAEEGTFKYQDQPLALSKHDTYILEQCDGKQTLSAIIEKVAATFETSFDDASLITFQRLKWARSLNLVKRDNRFTDDGFFMRLRRLETNGNEIHQWLFLPPFSQRVFTLCSGAYTCDEMISIIQAELQAQQSEEYPRTQLEQIVIEICLFFERAFVIAWIDDSFTREARLKEFLTQAQEGAHPYDNNSRGTTQTTLGESYVGKPISI